MPHFSRPNISKLKKAEILYEPLPIGRMGVRKDTKQVIVAQDFSCFGQMLEEYICFGAVNIILPSSSPEIAILDEMPLLLKKRIKIIQDQKEIETVNRILHEVRDEFQIKINEENNYLSFPKGCSPQLIESIDDVHIDLKKLALGFNHKIQVNINTDHSIASLRYLRTQVNNSTSRIVLAQLEGLLNQYKKIEFDAISTPKDDTPFELISLLDKLINDDHYLEYSDAITELSTPLSRESAILKIRELSRVIGSKKFMSTGWDYITKILKVWTGVPLPESTAIASLINGNELPSFVDMENAQKRAVDIWRNSNMTNKPLNRDGLPVAEDSIEWLPPLDGMKIRGGDTKPFIIGTVGQLKKALEEFQEKENSQKKTKQKKKK